jgi:hypothetical protein
MVEETKMQTFRVTDPSTGRTVKLTGDTAPTEQELEEVFASIGADDKPAAKPTVRELSRGMFGEGKVAQVAEGIVSDAVLSPLVATWRGLNRATSGFYDKAGAVADLANTVISDMPQEVAGVMPMGQTAKMAQPVISEASELFKNWSNTTEQIADDLPETGMGKTIDTIYEIIGGAVPITTEFALAKGAVKAMGMEKGYELLAKSFPKGFDPKATGIVSQVGQFSLLTALQEYADNPETESLARGAMRGATIGMIFPVAAASLKLLKTAGKNVAKAYVAATTGDKRLAQQFVDNPQKYNLNPTGSVKSSQDIKMEIDATKLRLDNEFKVKQQAFKDSKATENYLLNEKLKSAKQKTKETFINAKESLGEKSKRTLNDVTMEVKETIQKGWEALTERTGSIYNNTLEKYSLRLDEASKRVKAAMASTLEKNPGAGIDSSYVKGKFDKTMKEFNLFKINEKTRQVTRDTQGLVDVAIKSGQYKAPVIGTQAVPRTGGANVNDANTFNRILQEFNSLSKEKTLPLQYLQDLKKDTHKLSQDAFSKGDKELGTFYLKLSHSVDPAKAISENPQIAKGLSELANANKQYHTVATKYEELLKQHFKKNAQGGYVPNIDKAVKAIRGGDKVTLREMQKADMALPPEDRLLPQIQDIVREHDIMITKQKGLISFAKRKAQQEQQKLQAATRKTMHNLSVNQGRLSKDAKDKMSAEINNFNKKSQEEYASIINDLNKTEEFYKNQEKLRSISTSGNNFMRNLQRVGEYGAVGGAMMGRLDKIPAFVGLALGPAPIVSAGLVKGAATATGPAYHLLKNLLETPALQKVVGGRAIKK